MAEAAVKLAFFCSSHATRALSSFNPGATPFWMIGANATNSGLTIARTFALGAVRHVTLWSMTHFRNPLMSRFGQSSRKNVFRAPWRSATEIIGFAVKRSLGGGEPCGSRSAAILRCHKKK